MRYNGPPGKTTKAATCLEIATILQKMPDHLAIDPTDAVWGQLIGEGGYSEVYEVNWLGCAFAMKRFRVLSVSLKEEIRLSHPASASAHCAVDRSFCRQQRGLDHDGTHGHGSAETYQFSLTNLAPGSADIPTSPFQ